ncbi:hypothetical protein ABK040_015016 [Willaertia magna]
MNCVGPNLCGNSSIVDNNLVNSGFLSLPNGGSINSIDTSTISISAQTGLTYCSFNDVPLFVRNISAFGDLQFTFETKYTFEQGGVFSAITGIILLSNTETNGMKEYLIFGSNYNGGPSFNVAVSGSFKTNDKGEEGCDIINPIQFVQQPGNTGSFQITTSTNEGYLKVIRQDAYYFLWRGSLIDEWSFVGSLTTVTSKFNYIGVFTSSYSGIYSANFTNIDFNVPVCNGKLATDETACPFANQVCSSFNGTCECKAGWTGDNCSVPICITPCLNGTCTAPNTCTCHQGYSGELCENNNICFGLPFDAPGVCNSRGTCKGNDKCECINGYTGPNLCGSPYFVGNENFNLTESDWGSITVYQSSPTIDLYINSGGAERNLWNCQNQKQANLALRNIEYPNFSFQTSYSIISIGYGFHSGIILYYEDVNNNTYFIMFGPNVLDNISTASSISIQASLDIDYQMTAQKLSKVNGNYGDFDKPYLNELSGDVKVIRKQIVFTQVGLFLRTFDPYIWASTMIKYTNIEANTPQCDACLIENTECSGNNECNNCNAAGTCVGPNQCLCNAGWKGLRYCNAPSCESAVPTTQTNRYCGKDLGDNYPIPNYEQTWIWNNPIATGFPKLQLNIINETTIKIQSTTTSSNVDYCNNLGGVYYREIPYYIGWSVEARMTNIIYDNNDYASGLILYIPNPKRYYLKLGFHTQNISLSGDLGNGCFENNMVAMPFTNIPDSLYFKISRTAHNAYQFYYRANVNDVWQIIGVIESTVNFNRVGYFTMGYTEYASATFTDFKLSLPSCNGKNYTDPTLCAGKEVFND